MCRPRSLFTTITPDRNIRTVFGYLLSYYRDDLEQVRPLAKAVVAVRESWESETNARYLRLIREDRVCWAQG